VGLIVPFYFALFFILQGKVLPGVRTVWGAIYGVNFLLTAYTKGGKLTSYTWHDSSNTLFHSEQQTLKGFNQMFLLIALSPVILVSIVSIVCIIMEAIDRD